MRLLPALVPARLICEAPLSAVPPPTTTAPIGAPVALVAGPGNTATASVTSPALANPGSYLITAVYSATGSTNPYSGFTVDTISSTNGTALVETVQTALTPGNLRRVLEGEDGVGTLVR